MDKKPKISCIMSVYNTEKYLDECIQSILNQTYENFEFIISDDWSTDKSKEIIKKYAKKDKRIIFLDNKKNRWILPNLNDCINIAKWDYVAIMESDDISCKDRFEIEINEFIKNRELALLWTYSDIIDNNWKYIRTRKTILDYNKIKTYCVYDTQFITPWIMLKRDVLIKQFKKTENSLIRDTELYLNIVFSWLYCYNIDKVLIKKRELNTWTWSLNIFKLMKKQTIVRIKKIKEYHIKYRWIYCMWLLWVLNMYSKQSIIFVLRKLNLYVYFTSTLKYIT